MAMKKFNDTPASLELAAAIKRSVILIDNEGWGRERFLHILHQTAAYPWRVSDFDAGLIIVDGLEWWCESAVRDRSVTIDEKEIHAEPWNATEANGMRLKSTWMRIHGFPLKLWHRVEFEKLIEDVGVLLEVDPANQMKTSFKEAKIRIGIRNQHDIPPSLSIQFRTDKDFWAWCVVSFLIDTPEGRGGDGYKRKRVWVRKEDHDPEPPQEGEGAQEGEGGDQDEGGADQGEMVAEGDDWDWEGEDLLDEEMEREVREEIAVIEEDAVLALIQVEEERVDEEILMEAPPT